MGDDKKIIKHSKSIMSSPVVFGIKESKAKELDFINNKVSIKDILKAVEGKKLNFAMTSATQSNSGACAYLGFLNAALDSSMNILAKKKVKFSMLLSKQKEPSEPMKQNLSKFCNNCGTKK